MASNETSDATTDVQRTQKRELAITLGTFAVFLVLNLAAVYTNAGVVETEQMAIFAALLATIIVRYIV